MAMNLHIPILRLGPPYESLDKIEVKDHRTGTTVAIVSSVNAGIVRPRQTDAAAGHSQRLTRPACGIAAIIPARLAFLESRT